MHASREVVAGSEPQRVVLAMSSDGRVVARLTGDHIEVTGAGVAEVRGAVAIAAVDHGFWVVGEEARGHVLHRLDAAGAVSGPPVVLGALGAAVAIAASRSGARRALIEGTRGVLVTERDGAAVIEELGGRDRDRRVLVGPHWVAERRGGAMMVRRPGGVVLALPQDAVAGTVVGGANVFDGAGAMLEVEHGGKRFVLLYDLRRGDLRRRIGLGDARILAIAERRGIVVFCRGTHVATVDLRDGACLGERILRAPIAACAIAAGGAKLAIIDANGQTIELDPLLRDTAAEEREVEPPPVEAPPEPPPPPSPPPRLAIAPPAPDDTLHGIDDHVLEALCPPPATTPLSVEALEDYLGDLRGWIGSLCRTAFAVAWDAGRLNRARGDARDAAAELEAIVATEEGHADDALDRAREQEDTAAACILRWKRHRPPHLAVARELGLSNMGTTLLVLVAAPQIWGELSRAYGLCTADPARPLVDELLLAHLLEADPALRAEIGRELDDDSPLIASGAIERGRGLRPYAALAAHPAIARRLAGAPPPRDAGGDEAAPALSELIGPAAAIAQLATELRSASPTPARVVISGRRHAGRRTIAAALARQGRRVLGVVELEPGPEVDVRLRRRIREVALRGDLPCVTLDGLDDDPAVRDRVRAVLDAHHGPLIVRAPSSRDVQLAPGYRLLELPALDEGARVAAWQRVLGAHGLDLGPASELASRFAVGPGAMVRACRTFHGKPADTAALVDVLRQHRSARIGAIATRVERLAGWDELVVPDDIGDALRELCARVCHRRVVLEEWGMEAVATTARGVTALFQGGPGTGKTLAAGVVAKALGFELWRVDLSKVVSKWLGETEKNLAAVFDAAEDGEIVLLFDEADSLFGKRTEVKSSNDRNANLETNYLLQRLDTFTGVAVLTTNFGTAIDPAFRRRMSVHVQFPFPDETDRERLWRAHLPPRMPIAGALDLAGLARKYPLSGGYIRNAALRAAYLAAGERAALTTAHLHRAVALEYQRNGKLGSGRLE